MTSVVLLLAGLVVLLLTGLPLFAGLSLYGAGMLLSTQGAVDSLSGLVFGKMSSYLLVAIPLFALMAHVMIRGRIVDDLYESAYTITRHLPGGVGVATIIACTIFSAISGSSVATALTIGAVAIPQMIRYGYPPAMAYGLVAAGGTLGILIPPSGPMILYGVVTDTSIGSLFMAGIVPGLMLAAMFALWNMAEVVIRGHGKGIVRPARASASEIWQALRRSQWALLLPALVLGGMYGGVFTATEAAAIGAVLATLLAMLVYRSLDLRGLWRCAVEASQTSAMLFMILAGAAVFSYALTKSAIPQQVVDWVVTQELGRYGFLLAVMLLLIVMGMFLESIAIILITSPIVLPVLALLEIHPVWYGIMLVINLELAMITPPVGMNLFTVKAVSGAPLSEIIRGTAPYVLVMLAALGLVMLFPWLALGLPGLM